jgi:50S ribosomal protein L16 3-hydroxylase
LTAALALQTSAFLRDYWQRKPLLTKLAGAFDNPISPEELAGLAMEDAVESRLVRGSGRQLQLEHGPFGEAAFSGEEPWTLLVQCVDHHVPAVADLRRLVDFLPGWQLDDVMVSYATDGGGVGPHYDNYDVFLLQGEGERRWRLGQRCDAGEAQRDIDGLKILENFEQQAEYLLGPGDVLYVPPRLAHWGIAVGSCTTYSVGFRAPRLNDMLGRWTDAALPLLDPEQLYRDGLAAGAPGELRRESLAAAETQLRELVAAVSPGPDWFGELVTEPREDAVSYPAEPLPAAVAADPAARIAWCNLGESIAVYANGERLDAPTAVRPTLEKLCAGEVVGIEDSACRDMLDALWERGCLVDA